MNKLNVFYEALKVGEFRRDEQLVTSFQYSEEWLKDQSHFPLSLALPLKKEPFPNKTTLSFFENLLPEGEVRKVIGQDRHIESPYEFLKEFQTPFAWFDSEYKQVKISISEYAKEFFKLKKHLPSQEYKELPDGTAQLAYYVTNYMEIALLVKKWFPHLKIIEPLEWKERFNNEIKQYLENDK